MKHKAMVVKSWCFANLRVVGVEAPALAAMLSGSC